MNEKEKRLREERTREATRKGLTGMDGKFGTILRYLGQPMVAHGGSLFESTPMDNVYDYVEEDDDDMPVMDEDEAVMETGYHFDALSSGVHLEIIYKADENKLKAYYKGYLIYCEEAGELECYVPGLEWEDKVDYFYGVAKRKENKERLDVQQENKDEVLRQKLSFLQRLRQLWGN